MFFFNGTWTTGIYTYVPTLSLHDALPSWKFGVGNGERDTRVPRAACQRHHGGLLDPRTAEQMAYRESGGDERCKRYDGTIADEGNDRLPGREQDRKSTRLNSSH